MSRTEQVPRAAEMAGFSLVELLIVATIIAILGALAYPSLSAYLLKNQRAAAQKSLYALQLQQEEWRISHAQYATDISVLAPNLADHTHYSFSITEASSSHYQLTATVKSDSAQAQDRQGTQSCQTLTLSRSHEKTPAECWE
ncbi:type IV pilin protein [Oceanisphaera sp. IT1-181]|uniref:type IV pilin protein n=1 Tax=Oceanisphaera sp. IT1-181 TaxID=3081199 RepID=UPI0029C9CE50|nr:type IV pilin protein [Oceanisphaera sp. IT1-181]